METTSKAAAYRFKLPSRIRGDVIRACFPVKGTSKIVTLLSEDDTIDVLGVHEVSRTGAGSIFAIAMRALAHGNVGDEVSLIEDNGTRLPYRNSDFSGDLLRFGLRNPINIVVHHVDAPEEVVPIFGTDPGANLSFGGKDGWLQLRSFAQTSALGLHAFFDLYAESGYMDLGFSIGNGDVWGAGPRDHWEFLSIEIRAESPELYEFYSVLGSDRSVRVEDEGPVWLVAPREDGEPHAMPQRWERPIRVRVCVPGFDELNSTLSATYMGWEFGGYMPAGFPVAASPPQITSALVKAAKDEDLALFQGLNDDPNGVHPADPLWPFTGSTYGGVTGGDGIEVLAEVSAVLNAHVEDIQEMLMARSLRWRARTPGCMYGRKGHAILPPESGYNWEIYNRQFAWDKNKPGYHDPLGFTDAAPQDLADSEFAEVQALSAWSPPDDQHLIRGYKANAGLAQMTGDQLAIHYLKADAALAMAGCFHVDGVRSSRISPDGRVPATIGGMFGRGEAWVATLIALAAGFTDGPFRSLAARWAQVFIESASVAQTPIGVLGSKTFGKAFNDEPVNGRWAICRAEEEIFLAHALLNLAAISAPDLGIRARRVVVGITEALVKFAWVPGDAAAPDFIPSKVMDPQEPGRVEYAYRPGDAMPADLVADGVPKYAYHMGAILGVVERCSAMARENGATITLPRLVALDRHMDWLRSKKSTAERETAAAEMLELTLWGGPGGANPGGYQHSIAYLAAMPW